MNSIFINSILVYLLGMFIAFFFAKAAMKELLNEQDGTAEMLVNFIGENMSYVLLSLTSWYLVITSLYAIIRDKFNI